MREARAKGARVAETEMAEVMLLQPSALGP